MAIDDQRCDEANCAALIRSASTLRPKGVFVAHPDLYSAAEVRVANESVKRNHPEVSVVRGTIVVDGMVTNRVPIGTRRRPKFNFAGENIPGSPATRPGPFGSSEMGQP